MPSYRSYITPLAVAAAIALAPGATLAQGAIGTWAQNGDPSSCSPRSSGYLVVTRTAIEQANTKCRFGGQAPSGFASVSGDMVCTEGVASIDINASGNQLTVVKNGSARSYQRCTGAAATEPVFDGGNGQRQAAPLTPEEQAAKAVQNLLGGALSGN